jgi:hypothetical protein
MSWVVLWQHGVKANFDVTHTKVFHWRVLREHHGYGSRYWMLWDGDKQYVLSLKARFAFAKFTCDILVVFTG